MTASEKTPHRRRRDYFRPPSMRALVAVAIVALVGLAGVLGIALLTGKDAQDTATTVAQDTAPAVLTLDVLCKRDDQLGVDLRNAGACGEKVDKAKQAVDGQPEPQVAAAGLSQGDVVSIVQAQLAGKTVTVDQVMRMVTEVYNANRPADGKPGPAPTSEQVLGAVQAVCANNACRGPKGDDGQDAPPASPEQIFAQVRAYCGQEPSPCRGPAGPQGETGNTGPAGVSVVRQYFDRDEGGSCRTFTDFSDGRFRIDSGPAGEAACPPLTPPTEGP